MYLNRAELDFHIVGRTLPPPPAIQVPADSYIDLVKQGDSYLIDNDEAKAIESWDAAIALDPERPEAYTSQSKVATGTEEMQLLNLALSKGPYGLAYELRGYANNDKEKYELAIADLTKALETGVHTYSVYESRAFSYLNLGEFALSLDDINESIRLNQEDSHAWILKGFALYGLGICYEAADAFYTAVDITKGGQFEDEMRDEFLNNFNPNHCVDDSTTPL